MSDIVLINANNLGTYRSARVMAESLGIGVLCGTLEKNGFTCDIVDARLYNLSPEMAAKGIENYNYVGVSMFSFEAFSWVESFFEICKRMNKKIITILGGYYPTLAPERMLKLLPNADIIILGEGEVTIVELIKALKTNEKLCDIHGIMYRVEGEFIRNKPRKLIENLDTIPFPKRYAHEFADENFEILIEGGRGCMNNCTFCAIKPFYKNNDNIQWRGRSAESLIEEIKYIISEYPKPRRIRFVDPDFLGSDPEGINRAIKFCDLLKENGITGYRLYIETRATTVSKKNEAVFRKLKEVGLVEVYLGFESGSEYILKTMNKKISSSVSIEAAKMLKKWGIDYVYGFMMFTPWSRFEDLQDNISFLEKVGDIQFDKLFHCLDLIPGTPAVQIASQKGLLEDINEKGYYDYHYENKEVAKLASIWTYLQCHHMNFLLEIWYCYKDLKSWRQWSEIDAQPAINKLSKLSLAVFKKLSEYAKDNVIMNEKIDSSIDGIIDDCYIKLKEIHKEVDTKYCFPRNKMPGGA